MSAVGFFTPRYYAKPQTCAHTAKNFIEGYFDLKSPSLFKTILKVISFATLLIPAVMLTLKILLRSFASLPSGTLAPNVQAVIDDAPQFAHYQIGLGTPYAGTPLLSTTVRPANLFFNALLGPDSVTLPGHGLFAFRSPHDMIRIQIQKADPNQVISVNAKGTAGEVETALGRIQLQDLSALYGDKTCRFSYGEIQSTLASQRIHLSPLIPVPFYRALKEAFQQDKIVTLPDALKLDLVKSRHVCALVKDVRKDHARFGFRTTEERDQLLALTLYQIGAMVVKTEDFRILINAKGQLRERAPGEEDAIRLINACGIRNMQHTTPQDNFNIMKHTFHTALKAADTGFAVFPAVGMGVWGGDPNVYWPAFFDAVAKGASRMEHIFVNPGHQATPYGPYDGPYAGQTGGEFEPLLNQSKQTFADCPTARQSEQNCEPLPRKNRLGSSRASTQSGIPESNGLPIQCIRSRRHPWQSCGGICQHTGRRIDH